MNRGGSLGVNGVLKSKTFKNPVFLLTISCFATPLNIQLDQKNIGSIAPKHKE